MAQEIVQSSSNNSPGSSSATQTRKFSRTDAATLLGLLITCYSERKGANVEVLVQQWHDALRHYDVGVIDAAWRACRNEEKFFPSIATFLGYVRAERPPTAPTALSSYAQAAPDLPFCRDGRTEAEEVAYRASVVMNAKRQYGWASKAPTPEAAPAEDRDAPIVRSWTEEELASWRATSPLYRDRATKAA